MERRRAPRVAPGPVVREGGAVMLMNRPLVSFTKHTFPEGELYQAFFFWFAWAWRTTIPGVYRNGRKWIVFVRGAGTE
jgi:hypothetical protein